MVTNLEPNKQITAEPTQLFYSSSAEHEMRSSVAAQMSPSPGVFLGKRLFSAGLLSTSSSLSPPQLVIVRSHSWVIAVCVYLRCLPWRSSVTRACSFAMFSFSATSPG